MWSSTTQSLIINTTDNNFQNTGWYYISVYGYKNPSEFELMVDEWNQDQRKNEIKGNGKTMGKLIASSSNSKQCDNCKAWVPNHCFTIHSISCIRNNWRCSVCKKVIRKHLQKTHLHCEICSEVFNSNTSLQKHKDLTHIQIECSKCHIKLDRDQYQLHSEIECIHRLQKCKYCEMMMPTYDKVEHESTCGSKSILCKYCGVPIARKKTTIHEAVVHGINPSLGFRAGGRLNDPPSNFKSAPITEEMK